MLRLRQRFQMQALWFLKRIEDYTKLAARIKKGHCTEQFHRRVQRLKEENVMRSRELAKLHPLAPLLLQE